MIYCSKSQYTILCKSLKAALVYLYFARKIEEKNLKCTIINGITVYTTKHFVISSSSLQEQSSRLLEGHSKFLKDLQRDQRTIAHNHFKNLMRKFSQSPVYYHNLFSRVIIAMYTSQSSVFTLLFNSLTAFFNCFSTVVGFHCLHCCVLLEHCEKSYVNHWRTTITH